MAENQHILPDPSARQDFPEVKDKIVEIVELSIEPDYYGITIRFLDKTALTFAIEPCIFTFPIYSDWASGEEQILTRYQPIQSEIPRA
jgi:hypothetical protein